MFINDIWSYGVTTNTKKIVAEAQKDGYLLNFLQLDLDEDGLPNWKTINWSGHRHKTILPTEK